MVEAAAGSEVYHLVLGLVVVAAEVVVGWLGVFLRSLPVEAEVVEVEGSRKDHLCLGEVVEVAVCYLSLLLAGRLLFQVGGVAEVECFHRIDLEVSEVEVVCYLRTAKGELVAEVGCFHPTELESQEAVVGSLAVEEVAEQSKNHCFPSSCHRFRNRPALSSSHPQFQYHLLLRCRRLHLEVVVEMVWVVILVVVAEVEKAEGWIWRLSRWLELACCHRMELFGQLGVVRVGSVVEEPVEGVGFLLQHQHVNEQALQVSCQREDLSLQVQPEQEVLGWTSRELFVQLPPFFFPFLGGLSSSDRTFPSHLHLAHIFLQLRYPTALPFLSDRLLASSSDTRFDLTSPNRFLCSSR